MDLWRFWKSQSRRLRARPRRRFRHAWKQAAEKVGEGAREVYLRRLKREHFISDLARLNGAPFQIRLIDVREKKLTGFRDHG
jgi:hypothetical protein